ncbi:sigma-70 family RNA polymerase sigma factor [Nitrospirales bacterium NOB]|nr:sigma-70 family RNA polymerase sigma factor [Nitrospirales bacterium NOB]
MAEHENTTDRMLPWIKRYQAGDEAAWKQAIQHAHNRMKRIARKRLRNSGLRSHEQTDDLVNETCLRLLKAFPAERKDRPDTVRGFFAFATKKMRETLIDMYRRDRRFPRETEVPAVQDSGTGPTIKAARADTDRRVHELVDRLPDEEREAWGLHYYQGLTYAAAAAVLCVSSKTVERRVIAAKHKLHGWLVANGLGPEA